MKLSHLFKKLILVVPITLLCLLSFTLVQAHAVAHESPWVKDDARILDQKTIKQIDDLNENQLSKVKGHPQYAVITINGLPNDDDVSMYAHDKMNELGLGRKGWHNGVLFVLDVNSKTYRLEVGTGLQDALPDGAKDKIITDSVNDDLEDYDYNSAVSKISNNVFKRLKKNNNKILNKSQVTDKDNWLFGYGGLDRYQREDLVFAGMFLSIPVMIIAACMYFFLKNLKVRLAVRKMLKNDKNARNELKDAGIKKPYKYINYISKRNRRRLFANPEIDSALLIALLVRAQKTYNKLVEMQAKAGQKAPNPDVWGSSDNSNNDSFGSGFGGDSGGSDGGGFSGSY